MDQDSDPSRKTFHDPSSIDDMAAMYLSALKDVLASLKDHETGGRRFQSDVMYLLAQAQARWLTSALRYWQQVAAIIGTQGVDAIEAIVPEPKGQSLEAQQLVLLDKARAILREISELSMSEAKLLQRDLMDIEAELRNVVNSDDDDLDGPRRYAKPKS